MHENARGVGRIGALVVPGALTFLAASWLDPILSPLAKATILGASAALLAVGDVYAKQAIDALHALLDSEDLSIAQARRLEMGEEAHNARLLFRWTALIVIRVLTVVAAGIVGSNMLPTRWSTAVWAAGFAITVIGVPVGLSLFQFTLRARSRIRNLKREAAELKARAEALAKLGPSNPSFNADTELAGYTLVLGSKVPARPEPDGGV